MKPNCYECIHRRTVPGDAHSECAHPITEPFGAASGIVGMGDVLGIVANPHGVRSGWFLWPVNFDPVWLESCNGFESKKKDPDENKDLTVSQ